jgi:hypothetical protein
MVVEVLPALREHHFQPAGALDDGDENRSGTGVRRNVIGAVIV